MPATQGQIPVHQLIPLAIFFAVLLVMFWLVVIRPANKRAKEHMDLVRSLRPGDRIVTAGGIHGEIKRVGERTVDIEVAPGIVLKFDKYAVRKRQED